MTLKTRKNPRVAAAVRAAVAVSFAGLIVAGCAVSTEDESAVAGRRVKERQHAEVLPVVIALEAAQDAERTRGAQRQLLDALVHQALRRP